MQSLVKDFSDIQAVLFLDIRDKVFLGQNIAKYNIHNVGRYLKTVFGAWF